MLRARLGCTTLCWWCLTVAHKLAPNGSAAWRGAGLSALKPIRITKLKIYHYMSNEVQNPASCQTAVVRSASTKKCWNCKHRTQAFKVGKLTHYHCMSPTYEKQHDAGVGISPWETLRVFSDSCDEHELRS
jgi:hypothetical protein